MSIQPKTEQKVNGNVLYSQPAMSLESLIKDLQDKEKILITKKELEAMKTKMNKLEKEKTKLKADLVAKTSALAVKEEERLLYDRIFHQNVKELTKITVENKVIKAENKSLKTLTENKRNHDVNNSKHHNSKFRCELCGVYFNKRSTLSAHIKMWNH